MVAAAEFDDVIRDGEFVSSYGARSATRKLMNEHGLDFREVDGHLFIVGGVLEAPVAVGLLDDLADLEHLRRALAECGTVQELPLDNRAAALELANAELRRLSTVGAPIGRLVQKATAPCGCPMFERAAGEWIIAHTFPTCRDRA